MAGRLEGKVALVTGGASGIGAETSRIYAREGAKIAIADINDNAGHAVAQEIGDAAFYAHLDTRNEDAWQASVKQVVDTFGRLDVLVNAAGVSGRRPDGTSAPNLEEQDLEDWNRVMDVNSTGIFLGMKTAIPKCGRRVVARSSTSRRFTASLARPIMRPITRQRGRSASPPNQRHFNTRKRTSA